MNANDDLGRLLREHLNQMADNRPSEGALDAILATTAGIRPKRSVGQRLDRLIGAGLIRVGFLPSVRTARVALAVLLVALLMAAIIGSAMLGGGDAGPLGVIRPTFPTPSPTTSPAPSVVVAVTPAPIQLPKTFRSPIYHYTIGIAANWKVTPAKFLSDSPKATGDLGTDVITVTGTDTTIPVTASALGSQSFADWLKAIQVAAKQDINTPQGCDGGDPSTWPSVAIGNRQGVWQQMCNYAVAYVDIGGLAYQFPWENGTFDTSKHLSVADFKTVLESVTFP